MNKVTTEVLDKIKSLMMSTVNESGGLLGTSNGKVIDLFWFDEGRRCNARTYNPDVKRWEERLLIWYDRKIEFCGIIHSHLNKQILSSRDVKMAREILKLNSINHVVMPVLVMKTGEVIWYLVSEERVDKFAIVVV